MLIAAPATDPVELDSAIPSKTKIVVIGGGIIGVSTAYFLAARGIPVVVCEKGRLAGEQSSRNWGWVRKQGRDPRELPLIIKSFELWHGFGKVLDADTGFRICGILYLARTEAELAHHAAWVEHAKTHGLDTRIIAGPELERLAPGAAERFLGALYTESDGRAEPQKAVPAIAAAARRLGAVIVPDCAVRGVETSAGRVSLAVTERGAIACESVVLAGGAWSRLFCGNNGIDLPQLKVRGSVLRTAPLEGGPAASGFYGRFAYRRRLDGGYNIANGVTTVAEIVPDSFRLFGTYLPALRHEWRSLSFNLGRRFFAELTTPRRWALDQPTVFETCRALDPPPVTALNRRAMRELAKSFP
ncbi:MAG TPA: FAD-binding oxidoreductase, partial [Stellaceae bacterium]|nr:FAD-binding oxidoreductase [Stellaceae bacterium]